MPPTWRQQQALIRFQDRFKWKPGTCTIYICLYKKPVRSQRYNIGWTAKRWYQDRQRILTTNQKLLRLIECPDKATAITITQRIQELADQGVVFPDTSFSPLYKLGDGDWLDVYLSLTDEGDKR